MAERVGANRQISKRAGFDVHLLKPVDLVRLQKLFAENYAPSPANALKNRPGPVRFRRYRPGHIQSRCKAETFNGDRQRPHRGSNRFDRGRSDLDSDFRLASDGGRFRNVGRFHW